MARNKEHFDDGSREHLRTENICELRPGCRSWFRLILEAVQRLELAAGMLASASEFVPHNLKVAASSLGGMPTTRRRYANLRQNSTVTPRRWRRSVRRSPRSKSRASSSPPWLPSVSRPWWAVPDSACAGMGAKAPAWLNDTSRHHSASAGRGLFFVSSGDADETALCGGSASICSDLIISAPFL